jgi:hypothetical protein
MPFIAQEKRPKPDMMIAGDRCFREYKHIMEEWTKSPRWGTVDSLATRLYPDAYERAFFLAFLVHFAKAVMPYEYAKEKENGTI